MKSTIAAAIFEDQISKCCCWNVLTEIIDSIFFMNKRSYYFSTNYSVKPNIVPLWMDVS